MNLVPESLEPRGKSMSSSEAKAFLREYLLKTRGLTKAAVAIHIVRFSDELKFHLQDLRAEVQDAKESAQDDIRDLKGRLSEKRKALAIERDEERREKLLWDIEALRDEIDEAKQYAKDSLEEAKAALAAFIQDKRAHLCQYVNRELSSHATDA